MLICACVNIDLTTNLKFPVHSLPDPSLLAMRKWAGSRDYE